MIEKQELDPSFGNNELVLNILEAVMEDERSGFEVNARAGKTLAKVPCGQPGNKFKQQVLVYTDQPLGIAVRGLTSIANTYHPNNHQPLKYGPWDPLFGPWVPRGLANMVRQT